MKYWISSIAFAIPFLCLVWTIYKAMQPDKPKSVAEDEHSREGELSVNVGQLQDGHVIYIPMICRRKYRPGNPEIGTIGHSYYYNDYLRPWDFSYLKKCKHAEIYNDRQCEPFFASGTEAGALEMIEIVKSKTIL